MSTLRGEHESLGSLECYVKASRLVQVIKTVGYQIIDGFVAVVTVVIELVVKRAFPVERFK